MDRLTQQRQISRCLQSQEEERLLLLTMQSTPGAQGGSVPPVLGAEHVKVFFLVTQLLKRTRKKNTVWKREKGERCWEQHWLSQANAGFLIHVEWALAHQEQLNYFCSMVFHPHVYRSSCSWKVLRKQLRAWKGITLIGNGCCKSSSESFCAAHTQDTSPWAGVAGS